MEPGDDQLAVLHRLQTEGQITATEYAHLAAGIASSRSPNEDKPQAAKPDEVPDEDAELDPENPDLEAAPAGDPLALPAPRLRQDLSAPYIALIAFAATGLIFAGAIDLLSWFVALSAAVLLATTLVEGWRLVTISGTLLVAGMILIGFVVSLGETPPTPPAATVASPAPQEPAEDIPGSLGIHMDEVTDAWNSLDGEPRITKGLTRYNETGEYDTFIYRFGEWGRLAGAFDPDTEALYAVLAAGWLTEAPTSQLYLRLCFMVAPYSQECVDSYFEQGLGEAPLDELEGPYRSEWEVADHTWRLEIEENLLTIRVFGADAD